ARRPLVIDPALFYSTYLGGSDFDEGLGITVDAAGNAYVVGVTGSIDFPTTQGAFQTTLASSNGDAFVTKLNSTGSGLVYSTYLTFSNNFPITPGAFQTSPGPLGNGGSVFVTKLNPMGSALIYSTYLGGFGFQEGLGIAVDAACNGVLSVYGDAFVVKLDPTGSALIYSTYLGGSGEDGGAGIALDSSGNAYVVGATSSTDFPTTPGAFQTTFGGGEADVFVTKV